MKLCIFGGTGFTGTVVTEYALNNGNEVTLLVRSINTLREDLRSKVKLIEGDVKDYTKVKEALQGCEGVIVTLGTRNNLDPTTAMSDGLKNIIKGMSELNITLITCCLSSFLFLPPERLPAQFTNIHNEHKKMLEILKGCPPSIKWVGVCAPHIANEESTETVKILNEQRVGPRITVRHLAEQFVKLLTAPEHHNHQVGIGYPQ